MNAAFSDHGAWLDVRALARQLEIGPIELVRELVDDEVPVMTLGPRTHRVREPHFIEFVKRRELATVERVEQDSRRADFVDGSDRNGHEPPSGKVVFTR